MHRRILLCSSAARCQIVFAIVTLPFCAAATATASRSASDDLEVMEICSDDSVDAAVAFVRATAEVLAESKIRLLFRCAATASAPSASFIPDEGGIAVQLRSPTGEQSARHLPWLEDTRHPLESTTARGKATALGLLLGNLSKDLQAMPLRPLPGLSTPAVRSSGSVSVQEQPEESRPPNLTPPAIVASPEPTPPARGEGVTLPIPGTSVREAAMPAATEPAAPPVPNEALASPPPVSPALTPAAERAPLPTQIATPVRRAIEISLPLFGVVWMPPSTLAPQIDAGVAWGGPRWWATASGTVELDSNFAMDGRTFTSTGYGLRLGIRRTLKGSQRFRWDADATVIGHLNRYRRDGLATAQTHDWFDLGAALHSRMSLFWGRHLSLIVVVGAQFFPTAREASIPEGPSRRINLLSLTAVGGPCVRF